MPVPAEHPYLGYNLYLVFHRKMGRMMANLVNPNDRKDRKTTAYARYVMAVHLGRLLTDDETVDHDNEDKTDDSIGNLKIMTRLANKAKSQKPRTFLEHTCPVCTKVFKRRLGASFGVQKPSCSKSCAGIWSHGQRMS